MGRGSSKVGGGSGASGEKAGGGMNTAQTMAALNDIKKNVDDEFEATSQVADVLNQAAVGTQLDFTYRAEDEVFGSETWKERFVKQPNGRWATYLTPSGNDISEATPSMDSVGVAAGEIVNILYGLY